MFVETSQSHLHGLLERPIPKAWALILYRDGTLMARLSTRVWNVAVEICVHSTPRALVRSDTGVGRGGGPIYCKSDKPSSMPTSANYVFIDLALCTVKGNLNVRDALDYCVLPTLWHALWCDCQASAYFWPYSGSKDNVNPCHRRSLTVTAAFQRTWSSGGVRKVVPGELKAVDRVRAHQRPVVLHPKRAAVLGQVLPVFPCGGAAGLPLNTHSFGLQTPELENHIENLQKESVLNSKTRKNMHEILNSDGFSIISSTTVHARPTSRAPLLWRTAWGRSLPALTLLLLRLFFPLPFRPSPRLFLSL